MGRAYINFGPESREASEEILHRIQSANQSISIITPYFSPDSRFLEALLSRAATGTPVRLTINFEKELVERGSLAFHALRRILLDNRVQIFYDNQFHSKIYQIDRSIYVGSMNFTRRGLVQIDEIIATVSHEESILKVEDYLGHLCARAKRLTLEILNQFSPLEIGAENRSNLEEELESLENPKKTVEYIEHLARDEYDRFFKVSDISAKLLGEYEKNIKFDEEIFEANSEILKEKFLEIDLMDWPTTRKIAEKIKYFSKYFDFVYKKKNDLHYQFYNLIYKTFSPRGESNYQELKLQFAEIFENKLIVEVSDNGKTTFQIFTFRDWKDGLAIKLFEDYRSYFNSNQLPYPEPIDKKILHLLTRIIHES